MYLLIGSVKLETSFPPEMMRKITISNGRFSNVVRFAPASKLSPYSVYCARRMLCSQFKTSSWYIDHPCFLFHMVLSLPLSFLKVPIYVHNRSLGCMGSSARVRARVPKWVRLGKARLDPQKASSFTFLPACPTPGISQAPRGLCCSISLSWWILLGLSCTISFN